MRTALINQIIVLLRKCKDEDLLDLIHKLLLQQARS